MTAGLGSAWWQYLLLFLAVAASWAGVPVIGTAGLGAAAVAASQQKLQLAAVIVVVVVAGEVGGLGGYAPAQSAGRMRSQHTEASTARAATATRMPLRASSSQIR
jgi:membrane protein DedA with SNARE-associated domain